MRRREFLQACVYAAYLSALLSKSSSARQPGRARADGPPSLVPQAFLPLVARSHTMTTVYIDSVNGSDSTGTGATGSPYQTIGKAVSVAAAGDALRLRNGTYYETISTALASLTIQADTGHAPVWAPSQTALYTSWTKTGGRTNVYQTTDNSGQTYGAYNGATKLTALSSVAAVDGQSNSYFLDTSGHVLYVNIGGSAPTSINSLDTNGTPLTLTGGGGVLDGLTFQWTLNGPQCAAGNTYTVRNCTFQYMTTPYTGFFGLNFHAGSGHTVTGCTFANLEMTHSSGVLVDGTCSGATVTSSSFDTMLRGVDIQSASTVTVSSCTFQNMGRGSGGNGDGIQSNNVVVTLNVDHCTFVDCAHGFIRINQAGSVLNAQFCLGYTTQDWGYNEVYWGYIVDGGSATLYHCTAANLKRNTTGGGGTAFLFQTSSAGATVTYKNCIAYNCKSGFSDGSAGVFTLTEDYNCAYGNTGGAGNRWGPGAHDLTSDPTFTSSAGNSYTLLAGSPCRNAGVAIAGVNDAPGVQPPDIGYADRGLTASLDASPLALTLLARSTSLTLKARA